MKKDNTIDMNYIYRMITKIYLQSMQWMMVFILLVLFIVMPINFIQRSHEKTRLIILTGSIFLFLMIMMIVIKIVKKIKMSEEKKMFLLAFLLVVLFCFIGLIAFYFNPLAWSFILLGIMITVFIFKFFHKLILQSMCYITIGYLILSEQFSSYILPQKITVIALMIIASIVTYVSSKVIKELIEKLMIESKKEREANNQITNLNNELENRVVERTVELEMALDDLKNTQDRLVKTEGMQSFLQLANRLSHQINTPLGISLTSNSYVSRLIEDTRRLVENNEVTQNDMIRKLSDMNSACELIENNINDSIKVVDSLKRFSLYETPKKTNLKSSLEYLKIQLMESKLYKNVIIDIVMKPEKVIHIAENTLHEVVKSIIENSLIHGNRDDLVIQIIDNSNDKNTVIEIIDNGVGIEPEIYEEIFSSFYSTSPHNMGMGLFIAESIVYHNLNGKLYLDEAFQNGTKMVICIPNRSTN